MALRSPETISVADFRHNKTALVGAVLKNRQRAPVEQGKHVNPQN